VSNVPAVVLDWGRLEYGEAWQRQLELVAARQRDEIPDTLVLVEHPDVLTLGRGTHRENVLPGVDIPVFEIERGGDVTYHGPGQLVGYPIFQLRPDERDLRLYLRNLEEALIDAAATMGLSCGRKEGLTGMWTLDAPQRKLASLGVACKRWVTLHGFALNVSTDLSRFSLINPCGLDATVMASFSSCLGKSVTLDAVKPAVIRAFARVFGRDFSNAA